VLVGVVAALTLVVGFAVAQLTDVRAAGGAVLVLGGGWCAWRAWRPAGPWRVAVLVGLALVCFVAAHVLARGRTGPWASVVLVSLVLGVASWWLVSRAGAARGRRRDV